MEGPSVIVGCTMAVSDPETALQKAGVRIDILKHPENVIRSIDIDFKTGIISLASGRSKKLRGMNILTILALLEGDA